MFYRYYTILCCMLLAGVRLSAQDGDSQNSDYKLNLLQAPASPGANLIGTAPNEIQTFTDPSAFMVAVQNGVSNLNGFPSAYAVDIAPAWLFAGKKITLDKFQSNKVADNIWQSFVLSVAYNNTGTTVKQTDLGLGFKISLLRGHINDEALNTIAASDSILSKILAPLAEDISSKLNSDPLMVMLQQQMDDAQAKGDDDKIAKLTENINARLAEIQADANKQAYAKNKAAFDSLKSISEHIDFKRHHFKLDFAGGTALRFPGQLFDYSLLTRAGAWITAGYEWENEFSLLGIVRYMHNPDKVYYDNDSKLLKLNDLDVADGGLRMEYQALEGKFLLGGEIIYRMVLNPQNVNPAWRYVVNCDYQLQKNKHLTFTIGRDFDGTFNKDGNLVAALNYVMGLGNAIRSNGSQ